MGGVWKHRYAAAYLLEVDAPHRPPSLLQQRSLFATGFALSPDTDFDDNMSQQAVVRPRTLSQRIHDEHYNGRRAPSDHGHSISEMMHDRAIASEPQPKSAASATPSPVAPREQCHANPFPQTGDILSPTKADQRSQPSARESSKGQASVSA